MKENPILGIRKEFENRIKLGIMTILLVRDAVDYNELKSLLETSDGNLATHLKALEREELIAVHKVFIGKKPNTSYRVSQKGKKAFLDHLSALEYLIQIKNSHQ